MSIYNKNNKFVSYLLVLVSLFILVLFTKDIIKKIYENKDLKETYSTSLQEKKDKLTKLNELKTKSSSSQVMINKFSVEVKEDELLDYLYGYIEKINGKEWITYIKTVNINDTKESDLWFNETDIDITLRVPNEVTLKKILDYLLVTNSKYNFYLRSLSFKYDSFENGNIDVSIPLKVLQK